MPRTFEERTCGKCGGEGQILCPYCDGCGYRLNNGIAIFDKGKPVKCGECKGECFIGCPACENGKVTRKREVGRGK